LARLTFSPICSFDSCIRASVPKARAPVTAGLTDFEVAEDKRFFLDHYQANNFNAKFEADLPWKSSFSGGVRYGSGFSMAKARYTCPFTRRWTSP